MKKVMGLVKGRHEMPVTEYVFDEIKDVLDFEFLKEQTYKKLTFVTELELYVTGLTSATSAVISHCFKNNVNLTLLHYDSENKMYVRQIINVVEKCPWCGYAVGNGWSCFHCGGN